MEEKHIKGIQAILPTPYHDNLEIDYGDLERCVEFCIASEVHGIVTTVNASEFQLLSDEERKRVIKTVTRRVDERVPVMVGITGKTVQEAIMFAKYAQDCGADAVIAMPPYVTHISGDEIYEFYCKLNDIVYIPIVIQNFVAPVGTEMSLDLLLKMSVDLKNVKYIKEETERSPQVISNIIKKAGTIKQPSIRGVLGGMSGRQIVQEFKRGACGSMPACLVADVLVKLWRALEEQNDTMIEELYLKLLPIIVYDGVYPLTAYKEILKRRGVIKNSRTRLGAWGKLDEENHREITKLLDRLAPYFNQNWN